MDVEFATKDDVHALVDRLTVRLGGVIAVMLGLAVAARKLL